jgi:hypothetical protein
MKTTVNVRPTSMAIALLLASVARVAPAEAEGKKLAYADRPLTAVELPPSVLGDHYESMEGFRLDGFSDISSLPDDTQPIANKLKEDFAPLGVVSLADYSLFREKAPFNGVTVRVFIFDTAERREQWCQKKYEYDGWEQHYKVVDYGQDAMHVLDSTQTNKRIYQFDRVWITSHQLQDGTEHHKAAQVVIEQLTTPEDSETK